MKKKGTDRSIVMPVPIPFGQPVLQILRAHCQTFTTSVSKVEERSKRSKHQQTYLLELRGYQESTILDGPHAEQLPEASRSKSALTFGAVGSTRMVTKARARAKARV